MTAMTGGRKRIALYYNVGFGGGRRWLYEITSRLGAYHDLDFYCIYRAGSGRQFPDGTDVAQRTEIRTIRDLPRVPGKVGRILNLPASWIDFIRFDLAARRMASKIDAKRYDLVFVTIGDYTYAPLILRHLRSKTAHYCHEPMRTVYEPDVPRPYTRLPAGPLGWLRRAWRWVNSDYAGLRTRWDAQAARNATYQFANSRYCRDYARRAYGVDARVIYPGVDSDAFQPGADARERFVLSGPGAIVRTKGYDWAIRAVATILSGARPRLVVVGNNELPAERAYLEDLARELDVTLDIRVEIADTELKRLLSTASVMLYTPHLEPFGLAALEAMASGTPVVTVREGGPAETVRDGETGFLCDRDPQQLGAAVARLLDDAALRERMGAAARTYVTREWTWAASVDQLQRMLADAVDNNVSDAPRSDAAQRAELEPLNICRRES